MKKYLKNCDPLVLLIIYCFVVFAGSFLTLQLFSFGSKNATIKPAIIDEPPIGRASWTQNRHIPTILKQEAKPLAAVANIPLPEITQLHCLHYVQPSFGCTLFVYYRFLPRDPPSA